jgi:hypothetical protein
MKITIESTTKFVTVNGVPARIWEGVTEGGVGVTCFITRIAANKDADLAQFDKELLECRMPSGEAETWPVRMIL